MRCLVKPWPAEAKVLVVTATLFLSITCVQFFAAVVSHSTALLVDCGSMLVDALTYVVNLWAVCTGDAAGNSSLVSSGTSLVVLYGISAWGLADAVGDLLGGDRIDDDLDAVIVLAFGLGGLMLDLVALSAFRHLGLEAPQFIGQTVGRNDRAQQSMDASLVNMFSALSHVVADAIRSLTSIVLGALVLFDRRLNGSQCDDYATLVVATTILVGSVPLAIEWFRLVQAHRDARRADKKFCVDAERTQSDEEVPLRPVGDAPSPATSPRSMEMVPWLTESQAAFEGVVDQEHQDNARLLD